MSALARFAASFRDAVHALRERLPDLPPPADATRHAALQLHRLMFHRFLQQAGLEPRRAVPSSHVDAFLDGYRFSLAEDASEKVLTPEVFGCLFENHVRRKETGTYYTGRDVSGYIARSTIIPAFLDRLAAPHRSGLSVDDSVTQNVDLPTLAAAAIARCQSAASLRAIWDALCGLRILDPTCGCGEFLVASLRVLEPLYESCLAKMQAVRGPALSDILAQIARHPNQRHYIRSTILRRNLHGFDLMPEAVEIARMRLLLMLAAAATANGPVPSLRLGDQIQAADLLGSPAQFADVTRQRKFTVILGNPPYVESAQTIDTLELPDCTTATCGNLYAFVAERSIRLLAPHGRLGMIVPHSAFCTDRMAPLLALIIEGATTWISTYDIRPSKLFAGVDQRLAIFLRHASPEKRTYATRYHRWLEKERPQLFTNLRYLDISGMRYQDSIPKAGEPIEERIWHKIHRQTALWDDLGGDAVVYYHNAPRYWVRAMTFAPYFWNERDGEKLSVQVKMLPVASDTDARAVAALLNSSLFFWWWILLSDCRHLNRREIDRFPAGVAAMSHDCRRTLGSLCRKLMAHYQRHAIRKECRYKTTGRVVYDEFYPGRSKPILDEIDRVLAGHYDLTDPECDFVVNRDLKYRLGEN